jgi:hypothetical protein
MPGRALERDTNCGSAEPQAIVASPSTSLLPVLLPLVLLLTPLNGRGRRQRGHSRRKKRLDERPQDEVVGDCRICGEPTVGGRCTNSSCSSRRLRR